MGFGSARALLLGAGAAILALCARRSLLAQATGAAVSSQAIAVSVPFMGCSSSGQVETLEAPQGTSRSVPISSTDAHALAYYKSANGIGLLAPRGWYCEGASGSSGDVLFLSPNPIQHDLSGWHGLEGPAIEIYRMFGGTSGRYGIAEIMSRIFPDYRAFATRVLEGMDLPLPTGPYPKDTLTYRGRTIVEYNTPAQMEGLGNFESWLGKNALPIRGAAIIIGDPSNVGDGPDLVLLSVRFSTALSGLIPVIVDQSERETVGARRQ
jgi:hypothetical protein